MKSGRGWFSYFEGRCGVPWIVCLLVFANVVFYALFMLMDTLGHEVYWALPYGVDRLFADPVGTSPVLKFISICVCFVIAQAVLFTEPVLRDARHQVVILLFTIVADYFIIFTPYNVAGVLVFCVAHLVAIKRYAGLRFMLVMIGAGFAAFLIIPRIINPYAFYSYSDFDYDNHSYFNYLIESFFDLIRSAELVYYLCFIYTIFIVTATIAAFRRKQGRVNNVMSRLGMALFLLCDVNVLLWNITGEIARYDSFPTEIWGLEISYDEWALARQVTYVLMWTFYLPAQTMLAISGLDFQRRRVSRKAS